MKNYRSCFIVDVKLDKTIVLTDSQRNRYFIDHDDMDMSCFKMWFQKFIKGIAQTLTTFEYVDRGKDQVVEMHITRFFNVGEQNQLVNG